MPLSGTLPNDGQTTFAGMSRDREIAGFQENGRWRMRTLKATSLTEAKRERAALVVGLREGRIASTGRYAMTAEKVHENKLRRMAEPLT